MKKVFYLLPILLALGILVSDAHAKENEISYARCNLKIIKGNYITWVNWQAASEYLPVGTKVRVDSSGKAITITDVKTGAAYTLDAGGRGDAFLEKFITKNPINIKRYPKDIQNDIKDALARVGMTKEQVYIAMGPPAWITSGDTNTKTYDDIMASNLWVYKRRRFSKNIGVEFSPSTGQVIRTEGIWR